MNTKSQLDHWTGYCLADEEGLWSGLRGRKDKNIQSAQHLRTVTGLSELSYEPVTRPSTFTCVNSFLSTFNIKSVVPFFKTEDRTETQES